MYSVVFIFGETNCFRCCTVRDARSDISLWSTFYFTELLVKLLLVAIFGFFWFYKLEGVIILAVCFVYIFKDVEFFYLQFADDEAMITWCFCSAETSGTDESVLDFLAPEYVVNLIIHCYCFRHDIHCIAINKNWRSQNFDFSSLKNSPPGQFSASSNSGRYPWMLKFLLQIENYRSGSSECDFCIILILKGVTFQRQIIVPSVKQKFILSWRYFIWIYR